MPLRIEENPTFTHEVKAKVPVDGGYREDTCKVRYRVLSVDKLQAFDLTTPAGTRDFLVGVVADLDELVDERGKAIPYSDAIRDQVIGTPYYRQALVAGYFAGLTGAAQGN